MSSITDPERIKTDTFSEEDTRPQQIKEINLRYPEFLLTKFARRLDNGNFCICDAYHKPYFRRVFLLFDPAGHFLRKSSFFQHTGYCFDDLDMCVFQSYVVFITVKENYFTDKPLYRLNVLNTADMKVKSKKSKRIFGHSRLAATSEFLFGLCNESRDQFAIHVFNWSLGYVRTITSQRKSIDSPFHFEANVIVRHFWATEQLFILDTDADDSDDYGFPKLDHFNIVVFEQASGRCYATIPIPRSFTRSLVVNSKRPQIDVLVYKEDTSALLISYDFRGDYIHETELFLEKREDMWDYELVWTDGDAILIADHSDNKLLELTNLTFVINK